MYKQKTWKRVAVLFAGPGHELRHRSGAHLRHRAASGACRTCIRQPAAYVSETSCVAPELSKGKIGRVRREPDRPRAAGIKAGDIIVKVGDTDVKNLDEMVAAVRDARPGRRSSSSSATGTRSHHRSSTSPRPNAGPRTRHRRRPTVGAIGDRRRRVRARKYGTTTRSRRYRRPSPSPATSPSNWASRWRRSRPRSARWCTPSAAANATRRRRSASSAPSIIGGDAVRARSVGGVLVLPGPAELRARRDQPGAAAAVRRRPHRGRGVREDPQHDPDGARHGGRGAGQLPQADARHLRRLGRGGRLHAADRDR